MRMRTGRFRSWRVRRSLLATAVLSSVLVPATLIVTAQPASAAPGTYYCDSYSANPIKVNNNGSGGYAVEQLTGIDSSPSSSSIHTLGISEINALGISPVDDKAYGIVPRGSNPNSLLVRFDDDEVQYVAEVEESATQGTFDVHGDYIYGDESGVYRVRRPDLLTGYTSSSDSGISDQSSPTTLVSASTGKVADWAAIRADLGSGAANYLVGLAHKTEKVVVVKYQTHGGASDTATGSTIASLTPSTDFPNDKAWRNAWYWQGRIIFQHKNGDVYEVGTNLASDLSGTADVTDLGNDDNINDGDGMNCFDAPGFTVAESSGTSVNESGTTDTFTVVLDSKPAGNVVIGVTSGDTGEATVSAASLTFTTGNWDSAQTITVTGVDDGDDDGDINSTITLAITDGSTNDVAYDAVADQTVTATTVDNDPAAGFTVTQSDGSTAVSESGSTDTFTVVLTAEPDSNVVISVVSADTGEATVSAASLTFTTGNWDSAQTITVTGVDDDIIDGSINTTITLAVVDGSSDNNFDPLANQTVTAATADNDSAGFTVTQSGGSTQVSESGSTDTFTVVLTAEPDSNVVISVVSADTGEATVSAASLTFTTGNWDSAQTITVTGVDDGIIDGSINTTITLAVVDGSSDNNFDPLANQTVTAATADNDSAGFTKSKSTVSVSETGTTDTFTVVLTAEPDSNVVISVTSGDTGEATVSASSLTFTTGNWDSAQTITVTGVDDGLIDGSQNSTITLAVVDGSSDNNFDPLANQTVTAATADNDSAGFTKSKSTVSVSETGTTDTFTVVLNIQPASDVVISVTSGDTGEATVSASTLTFTSGNWNSAQTITVTGVDDDTVDGSQDTTITLAVVDGSSDNNFDSLSDQTITATTADPWGFTVTQSSGTTAVSETGTTDTFTVVLNAQPASNVVISVTSGDTGEATVSASTLTFTNGNWDSAQTITVTGVDETDDDGDVTSTVTLAVVDGSSNDNYDPLDDQTVTVTTVDNDEPGGGGGGGGGGGAPPPPPVRLIVTQSNNSTYVSEDETTDTFTVALDTEPTGNVVVLVSGGDITELTLAPAALIFTSTDWNIPQTVTVTGVDDILFDGIRVTYITISVFDELSADEYGAAPSISILVDTYDNEVAGYTVVESGGSTVVSEDGDTDSFTVVLDERPGSNVAFSVTSQDEEEGLVSPFMLTFTPSSWDTPQTVVVTGVNDGLDDGDQDFLVVVSVVDNQSDSAFTALSDTPVSAVNLDNDDEPEEEEVEEEEVEDVLPACVVGFGSLVESEGSTVMSESGSSDSFTFALGSEPAGDVVVSVASSDLSEAVVLASALTFTASNWDTPQTVVVTGVNDGLSDGDQAVDVTLSAVGFEPVVVGVINADND